MNIKVKVLNNKNLIQLKFFINIIKGIRRKYSKSKIKKIIKIKKKLLYIGMCLLLRLLNPHSILFIKLIYFLK